MTERLDHLKWVLSHIEAIDLSDVDEPGKDRHRANIIALKEEIEALEVKNNG